MVRRIGRDVVAVVILVLIATLWANAADLTRINKGSPPESGTQSESELRDDEVNLVIIDIGNQKLYACQIEILREVVISTAKGNYNVIGDTEEPSRLHNHLGLFQVYMKNKNHYSSLYNCPMPYSMFFHGGHAIHATEPKFYPLLGTPASHGCVRTHLDDAQWLFKHTPMGAKVIVIP